jgi:hypothetical protein
MAKPTKQDYVEEGAKRGAVVGAIGTAVIVGVAGGGLWGALIGGVAGGMVGAGLGAGYGAWKAGVDGVGSQGSTGTESPGSGGSEQGSESSGECFVAGTLVATDQGMRPIELIKPGDKVYSLDMGTSDVRIAVVDQVFESVQTSLIDQGVGGETISCTPRHRFFTDRWVPACDLVVGDLLRDREGGRTEVHSIEMRADTQSVFNLSVSDMGNYFVGRSQLLVHNLKEQEPSDPNERGHD